MADIALAVLNRLAATDAVTALVADRVYPETARQEDQVYPLVVYKIDIQPDPCFDGPSGIETAKVQLAVVADTYAQASAAGDAIRATLDGQRGTWAGVVVQGAFLQDQGIVDDVITEPTTAVILSYVKNLSFDVIYET